VISLSGATLATFWLSSEAEAARWARELDSAANSVLKMLSLSRRQMQMDTIRSVQALWEVKIAMAQESTTQRDGPKEKHGSEHSEGREVEFSEVSEKEQDMSELDSDFDNFTDLPKTLSFDRLKVEPAASTSTASTARLSLEEVFEDEGGQPAVLQEQSDAVQATPRTLRIAELEERLATAAELPKLLSLNRKQVHELVQQAAEREAELATVRQRVLRRRAQELLKPRTISSTTTSVRQGPAVVREVVAKPFIITPKTQRVPGPRNPQAALPVCPGDCMAACGA